MSINNKPKRMLAAVLGLIFGSIATGMAAESTAEFAAPLNAEYEYPGFDYTQYNKLLIHDLDVSETKILPPPWVAGKPFKWQVSERNIGALQKEFHASMAEQITGNGGYEIVTEPDEGVLEISVSIISFMPYAERKEKAVTKGSGEMHISAEIRDALTGKLLAIYEGPQEVGKDYQENTDFTRQKNLKRLFDSWGARIRMGLDEGHDHT